MKQKYYQISTKNTLGKLPVWNLKDLYESPKAKKLSNDLNKLRLTAKKFEKKYEIKKIVNNQQKIDILINNAGNNIPEHFTKVKTKNMEYLVKINTVATFSIAQLCALKMIKSKKIESFDL